MDNYKKEAIVVKYLKEKYNRNFEVVSFLKKTWGMPGDRIEVKEKDNNIKFIVIGEENEKEYILSERYEELLRPVLVKDKIHIIAKTVFKEYRVHIADGKITIVNCSDNDTFEFQANKFIEELSKELSKVWVQCYNTQREHFNKAEEDDLTNIYDRVISYYIDKDHNYQNINQYDNIDVYNDFPKESNFIPLNQWQIERLCIIVYLDEILLKIGTGSLLDLIGYIRMVGLPDKLNCMMTFKEWEKVLDGICKDNRLCKLIIKAHEEVNQWKPDVLPGHRVVCFMDSNDNAYIIFRGTCGDSEWEDNADGMIKADTTQQKAALNSVIRMKERFAPKSITVAGHSKGGNKAQYTAIVAPNNYIDRCVSVDGQGFSIDFMKKYQNKILNTKNLFLIAEQRDFVNCLGVYLSSTTFYRGYRRTHTIEYPYGKPLPYFHCPDGLRDNQGEIVKGDISGAIPSLLNHIVVHFLTDISYKYQRENTIKSIISLMMNKRYTTNEQIADAIANLAILFIELTATDKKFNDELSDLIFKESDVLISTIESVFETKETDSNGESLGKLTIEAITDKILSNILNQIYLVKALLNINKLLKKIIKLAKVDKKISEYILNAICSLLDTMSFKLKSNGLIAAILVEFKVLCKSKTGKLNLIDSISPESKFDRVITTPSDNIDILLNRWVVILEKEQENY